MTTIAAAVLDDYVIMACDSQVSIGQKQHTLATPKIWETGHYVIGGTGSLVGIQAIKYYTDWPDPQNISAEKFGVRYVVPAIFKAAEEARQLSHKDGVRWMEASFLVGYEDKLISVGSYGTVMVHEYEAIGSGGSYALGVLSHGTLSEDLVQHAVNAATVHDRGSSGPICTLTTKRGSQG